VVDEVLFRRKIFLVGGGGWVKNRRTLPLRTALKAKDNIFRYLNTLFYILFSQYKNNVLIVLFPVNYSADAIFRDIVTSRSNFKPRSF